MTFRRLSIEKIEYRLPGDDGDGIEVVFDEAVPNGRTFLIQIAANEESYDLCVEGQRLYEGGGLRHIRFSTSPAAVQIAITPAAAKALRWPEASTHKIEGPTSDTIAQFFVKLVPLAAKLKVAVETGGDLEPSVPLTASTVDTTNMPIGNEKIVVNIAFVDGPDSEVMGARLAKALKQAGFAVSARSLAELEIQLGAPEESVRLSDAVIACLPDHEIQTKVKISGTGYRPRESTTIHAPEIEFGRKVIGNSIRVAALYRRQQVDESALLERRRIA